MIKTSDMIQVFQIEDNEWVAQTSITFFSSKGKQEEVCGTIKTYCSFNSIANAIDALLETLKESGIICEKKYTLTYTYMGIEDQDNPPVNKNWKEIIIKEAESRDWEAFVEN